jgi:hypothetical protein
MLDENWNPSDTYPATLYFHCPNTNCDDHVKLRDRATNHATRCEKCGLEFAIGADPELRKGAPQRLASALSGADRMHPLLVFVAGILLGLLAGIFVGRAG